MQIPEELLEKWKVLRSHGDSEKIFELYKGRLKTKEALISSISRAFNDPQHKCPDNLFIALRDFYSQKERDLYGKLSPSPGSSPG